MSLKNYSLVFIIFLCANQFAIGQCGGNQTEVIVNVTPPAGFFQEISWDIVQTGQSTPIAGRTCGSYTSATPTSDVVCLNNNIDFTINAYDDWGDGWGSPSFYEVIRSADNCLMARVENPNNGSNGDDQTGCGVSDLEASSPLHSTNIIGCTNPNATNYNDCATIDDGTCLVPLANDSCIDAALVACGDTINGTTDPATANGQPSAACGPQPDAPGVWYLFQGNNTTVTASLCNSAFDTRLHVYAADGGCDPNALQANCVGGSDDNCGDRSEFSWYAAVGTDYYILTNGWNGTTGDFQLTVNCVSACTPAPANEICATAEMLTIQPESNPTYTSGSTICATDDGNAPTCNTLGNVNDVWYSFQVGCSDALEISIIPNIDTAIFKFAIYEHCDSTPIFCAAPPLGNDTVTTASGLIAESTHYLQVWSPDDHKSDFQICIQEVSVDCSAPTDLEATNITETTATLEFSSTFLGRPYILEWGTEGFTPGSGNQLTDTITRCGVAIPHNLSGLTSNGKYDAIVSIVCSSGDTLSSSVHSFQTRPCAINAAIPDNGCGSDSLIYSFTASATGDSLGHDVILESVDLIIEHTWDEDLTILLESPAGQRVLLSSGNGGTGDNYGDPTDCPNAVCNFSMDGADGSVTSGSAPFIGSYIPEGDFASYNDSSDPNGTWKLYICDAVEQSTGSLYYIHLNFAGGCNPDDQAPMITCPPDTGISTDSGSCTAVFAYTIISEDNCSETLNDTLLLGLSSGSGFPVGNTLVRWQTTDDAGHTAGCNFNVNVMDMEAPTLVCPSNDTASCDPYTYTVTSSDNCSGSSFTQTAGIPSGSLFPVGNTENTFMATDAVGNTKTCRFSVYNDKANQSGFTAKISDTEGDFTGILNKKDAFGHSVSYIGDIDGNGFSELAVGMPQGTRLDATGKKKKFSGVVWILFMGSGGEVLSHQEISIEEGGIGSDTLQKLDNFGSAVAPLGDFNNDGTPDIVVGASGMTSYVNGLKLKFSGGFFMCYLNNDGTVKSYKRYSPSSAGVSGGGKNFTMGTGIAARDIDNDGVTDVLVGAPGTENQLGNKKLVFAGAVNVFLMNADGSIKDQVKITTQSLSTDLDKKENFGHSLAFLEGNRLIVGAPGHSYFEASGKKHKFSGAAYILDLSAAATVTAQSLINGNSIAGLQKKDALGFSVAGSADIDGNGTMDLIAGAPGDSEVEAFDGAVYAIKLDAQAALLSFDKINAPSGVTMEKKDFFGYSVSANNALCSPIIAASAIGDDDGNINNGAVYQLMPMPVVPKLAGDQLSADDASAEAILDAQLASELTDFSFAAYPNPSQNSLNLELKSVSGEPVQVRLFDLRGQLLIEELVSPAPGQTISTKLDVSRLSEGTFLLQLSNDKTMRTTKLIKAN